MVKIDAERRVSSQVFGEAPSKVAEVHGERGRIAAQALDRLALHDLGSGPLLDPSEREQWIARAVASDDVLGMLTGPEAEAEHYLEAAKQLGFETVESDELRAVWAELYAFHQLGLYPPAAIRPYLEAHGAQRTAWAILKVHQYAETADSIPADFAAAVEEASGRAAANG